MDWRGRSVARCRTAAGDGVGRAVHVHETFVNAFEWPGAPPGSGRMREDLTGTTVRGWTVFRFAILYETERSPIEIVRVLHGMRNLGHPLGSNLGSPEGALAIAILCARPSEPLPTPALLLWTAPALDHAVAHQVSG